MARGGGTKVLPGPVMRPEYKVIRDFRGGLNVERPPDIIADNESPDMLNLVFADMVLAVDNGLVPFGPPVNGTPQKVMKWLDSHGNLKYLLLTTRQLYILAPSDVAVWQPVLTTSSASATVVGGGNIQDTHNVAVYYNGTVNWTWGKPVSVLLDDGSYVTGSTYNYTTGYMWLLNVQVPAGRTLAANSGILPALSFNGDPTIPVSYVADPIANILIFTNGVDNVMKYDGSQVQPLDNLVSAGITAAAFVARFHTVTCLFGTTESGVTHKTRIRRSATNDSTNWTTLNAGFDDLADKGDNIVGVEVVNPYLIIFLTSAIVRASYYGVGQQVFYYDYGNSNVGMLVPGGSAGGKTDCIFVSESGFYRYAGDYTLNPISEKIFNAVLNATGDLNFSAQGTAFMFYFPTIDETWFCYPSGASAWPNKVMRYSHRTGGWFPREWQTTPGLPQLAFVGMGFFDGGQARTWATITGTWSQQSRRWNSRANQSGRKLLLLCGATDNQVYQYDVGNNPTDNGQVIPWHFTTKDYPMPEDWTTLDAIVLYGSGLVDAIEVSTDGGNTFQLYAASVQMGATFSRAQIQHQVTADFYRFRLSGTDPSFRLSWIAFMTMKASEL